MTLRAIGLMVLAMALLAASDTFIKLASGHLPVGQVMLLLSLGGTALFALLGVLRRDRLLHPDLRHPMVVLRCLFEIVGGVGMVIGISHMPLSIFAAIMQTAPLATTLGAALFLGEQVGIRRWAAIALGLAGMLLVLRPGGEGFTPWALFGVMGVLGLAARDLVTRLAPHSVSSLALSTWGFAATIPAGAVVLAVSGDAPNTAPIGLLHVGAAILVTTSGYLAVTTAMRMAPVAIVAPFRYTRLLFTAGLGIAVFAERPDLPTWIGAGLILAAGLYSFLRERRLARDAAASAEAVPGA